MFKKLGRFDKSLMLVGLIALSLIISQNVQAITQKQYTQSMSFTTTIQAGSMTTESSYLIFQDTSYYYLRNGKTGKIDSYQTDFSAIWQSAIDNLPEGGSIHIGSGNFTAMSQVVTSSSYAKRLIIEGEGISATVINSKQGLNGTLIIQNIVTIRDIRFNVLNNVLSTSPTDIALYFNSTTTGKSLLENVFITRFGIAIKLGENGVSYVNGLDIIHCNIYNNYIGIYFTGINIHGASQWINMYGGCIELSRGNPIYVEMGAYVGFYGVYLGNQAMSIYLEQFKDFIFDKCSFEPSKANVTVIETSTNPSHVHWCLSIRESGFDLVGTNPSELYNGDNGIKAYNVSRLIIERDTIADVWTGKYFLNATECTRVQVLEPRFYQYNDIPSGTYFIGATYIRCDVSSGNTTIADNEWVTHNLIGTPRTVTITPRDVTFDSVTFVVGVVARNSTMFQVGAYWTNGTAISDDAIIIDWYAEYEP